MAQRGSHTTTIEQARPFLSELKKREILFAPGIIEVIKRAKTKTAKWKKINAELFELVITAGSSKQSFKVFHQSGESFWKEIGQSKQLQDWNIGYIDTSKTGI